VLFAFILLFFDLLSLTVVRKRTDYTRNESSRELSFQGVKVPTGNFHSEERKYRGEKRPDTVRTTVMLRSSLVSLQRRMHYAIA